MFTDKLFTVFSPMTHIYLHVEVFFYVLAANITNIITFMRNKEYSLYSFFTFFITTNFERASH
jgi:hypothetical protein